jgi:predicted alpha/beta-hydrolase family hydrolase
MMMALRSGTLLLFPGAGSGRDQSTLVAVDRAVSALSGWSVVRADFPYRKGLGGAQAGKAGRRAPDKPEVLMAAVRDELAAIGPRRNVVVGGRSMGGRICSMVAAGVDGIAPPKRLAGVVTISYPLHPPGRPDRLRVEHLTDVGVPWLFVHGDRDPFGSPDELQHWSATVGGPVTHQWFPGGHDLKGKDAQVAAAVAAWLRSL